MSQADEAQRLLDRLDRIIGQNGNGHSGENSYSSYSSYDSSATSSLGLPPVPPFPIHVLPPDIGRYVIDAAEAIGAPTDFVGISVLGLAEGTIGASRAIEIKAGFEVAAGSWYGFVGDPGTVKSPAMKAAIRLVRPLEDDAERRFREEVEAWHDTPKEERGPRPRREHFFVTDSTIEALGDALAASAGVTQFEDELLRRLKALDAYRKAGDRQVMLSLWSNAPIKITRRTSESLYVAAPSAPLVGGTQPAMLAQVRGDGPDAAADDGWVPRFCIAWPDADIPEWTEATVSHETLAAAQAVFFGLRLHAPEPHVVRLSGEAYQVWKSWFKENTAVQRQTAGLERQWAAKAPVHLARFALVLHALHTVRHDEPTMSAATLNDAIELVEYFRAHLRRVLPAFGSAALAGGPLATRILRFLAAHQDDDGWMRTTELHGKLGGHIPAEQLRTVLDTLLAAGKVEQSTAPSATRPAILWRLARSGADDDSDDAVGADDTNDTNHTKNTNYSPPTRAADQNGANNSYSASDSEYELFDRPEAHEAATTLATENNSYSSYSSHVSTERRSDVSEEAARQDGQAILSEEAHVDGQDGHLTIFKAGHLDLSAEPEEFRAEVARLVDLPADEFTNWKFECERDQPMDESLERDRRAVACAAQLRPAGVAA